MAITPLQLRNPADLLKKVGILSCHEGTGINTTDQLIHNFSSASTIGGTNFSDRKFPIGRGSGNCNQTIGVRLEG